MHCLHAMLCGWTWILRVLDCSRSFVFKVFMYSTPRTSLTVKRIVSTTCFLDDKNSTKTLFGEKDTAKVRLDMNSRNILSFLKWQQVSTSKVYTYSIPLTSKCIVSTPCFIFEKKSYVPLKGSKSLPVKFTHIIFFSLTNTLFCHHTLYMTKHFMCL